jgi:hypothetical protein
MPTVLEPIREEFEDLPKNMEKSKSLPAALITKRGTAQKNPPIKSDSEVTLPPPFSLHNTSGI